MHILQAHPQNKNYSKLSTSMLFTFFSCLLSRSFVVAFSFVLFFPTSHMFHLLREAARSRSARTEVRANNLECPSYSPLSLVKVESTCPVPRSTNLLPDLRTDRLSFRASSRAVSKPRLISSKSSGANDKILRRGNSPLSPLDVHLSPNISLPFSSTSVIAGESDGT